MVLINERERAGENSEHIFEYALRDTNEHDLPDVDGDDSNGGDGFAVENHDDTVVKIVNNLDVAIDVRLEMTNYEDGNFDEAYNAQTVTGISAGSVDLIGMDVNPAVDLYRVVVSTNGTTAPSNGKVKAVFENDRET